MSFFISVKERDGSYKHHSVPEPIYTYIHQLEAYIRDPSTSKLLLVYPDRFRLKDSGHTFNIPISEFKTEY